MSDYTGTDNLEVMAEAANYNQFLLSLVSGQAKKTDVMMDFGAGIGTFAKELGKSGFRVHCIEPDARQAAVIASSGLAVSTSIEDVDDSSVDYFYTLNVLEHIEDDTAMLRRLHAKLKPGGKLLIYVPAFQVLYSSMDRKVGHFRRYTRADLTAKLKTANFSIAKSRYVDSLGFFATLAFRLAGNDSGDLNRGALVLYDRIVFPVSRIFDFLCGRLFGKNVLVIAIKPGEKHA